VPKNSNVTGSRSLISARSQLRISARILSSASIRPRDVKGSRILCRYKKGAAAIRPSCRARALARLGFELRWITRLRDTAKNLGIALPA
jgi:hypothetical protein